jgi:hypothetical protein
MDQSPDTRKSVGQASDSNEIELDEVAWQKWLSKGKAQDVARRKKVFLALWLLLPVGVLLAIWALALRR